ncbi:MAG: hypothetical protein MUF83_12505 [Acidimicrobiales bacterium]|jgi:hypothetical protein|nr:hypothetical protein [Acidimicrobiales bacterium]
MRPRATPTRLLLVPVVAALCAVAACGGAGDGAPVEVAGGQSAPAPSVVEDPTLPTLPPVEERADDLFDEQGCTQTGPDAAACGNTGAEIDAAAAGDSTEDWRTLAGFVGPHWNEQPAAGAPVVLEQTVAISATGAWTARGLVRNETSGQLDGIEVTAQLLAADGSVLASPRATSPVVAVRSGEPVPFELTAEVPAEQVTTVQWSAAVPVPGVGDGSESVASTAPSRDAELTTFWSRDHSGADRIELYLYRDPDDGSRPYLLFGSVLNRGAATASPTVVVAWLDGDGRVVAVHEAPVADPRTGLPAEVLDSGAGSDFLVVLEDPAEGFAAGPASPMLWGLA